MIWFKHYADARNSTTMKMIIKRLGLVGYAQALCLLEMCAAKWDQKDDGWAECQFRFHNDYLCQELRMKPKRSRNVLGTFQECSLILVSHNDDTVVVTVPKLLEYFDKHTKHNRTRVVSKPVAGRLDKNRIEKEIIKEKSESPETGPEEFETRGVEEIWDRVPQISKERILKNYGNDPNWLRAELEACVAFFVANPPQTPKNGNRWAQKFVGWLKNADERRQKFLAKSPKDSIYSVSDK